MKNRGKNENTKKCSKCKLEKELEKFRHRSDKPHLYHSWCLECEYATKKQYLKTDQGKQWLDKLEHSEQRKVTVQKYRTKNAKKIKDREAKHRLTESYKISQKRYRTSEKGKIAQKARSHTRRLRVLQNTGQTYLTKEIINDIVQENKIKYSELTCVYCLTEIDNFHIDHILAVSKGGDNSKENLCVACPFCNQSKKDKLVEDFMSTRTEVQEQIPEHVQRLEVEPELNIQNIELPRDHDTQNG